MGTQPELDAALALFHQQGWATAELSEAPELPLGSRSEQSAAARGLRSADFDAVMNDGIDPTMLGLFAIRLGVEPRIALSLLADAEQETVAECVALRGEKYAAQFISEACYLLDKENHDLYGGSYFGYASVMLVVQDNGLELEIPHDAAYLHDWVAIASDLFSPEWVPQFNFAAHSIEAADLKETLREHIFAAAAMGLPVYGPLGHVLLAAIGERKLSRQTLIAWTLEQLIQQLPKLAVGRIVQLLNDELKITNKEIKYNSGKLTDAIRCSDLRLMDVFGLRLLKAAPRSQVAKIAALVLSHPSNVYQAHVLELLKSGRSVSRRQQQLLIPQLLEYQRTAQENNAALVDVLLRSWDSPEIAADSTANVAKKSLYRWQPMPGTWQPAPVEYPKPSFQSLREQAEELPESVSFTTLEIEYFWNTFLRLSRGRLGTLVRKIRGVDRRIRGGSIAQWIDNPLAFKANLSMYGTVTAAREREILENLGTIPCLLSTPSFQDLSVNLDDFLSRLRTFEKQDKAVPLLDLYFALCRLDLQGIDADTLQKRCEKYSITISISDGPTLTRSCVKLLQDFQELALLNQSDPKDSEHSVFGRFLRDCLSLDSAPYFLVADTDDSVLIWQEQGLSREVHDYARQVARGRYPLNPTAAMRLLLLQCETATKTDIKIREVLTQAWYRGLINPAAVDVSVADWGSETANLAAFIAVLTRIVDDGMLALSWQVLDQLLGEAVQQDFRQAEIATMIAALQEFYPSVRAAVGNNQAPAATLALPGLRQFVKLGGHRHATAITAAKRLLELIVAETPENTILPEVVQQSNEPKVEPSRQSALLIDEYWFGKNWVQEYGTVTHQPDDASVVIYNPKAIDAIGTSDAEKLVRQALDLDPRSLFANDIRAALVLPKQTESVYIVESGRWLATGEFPHHWQAIEKLSANIEHPPWLVHLSWLHSRGWLVGAHEEDVRVAKPEVLPDSIATIMIGFLAAEREQDDVISLIKTYVESGLLGSAAIKAGMPTILKCPDWRPQIALKILKEYPELLAALWPIITEPLKVAGLQAQANGNVPRWVNPVLLFAIDYGPVLSAATVLGYITEEDWAGVYQLAASEKKNRGIKRAQELQRILKMYVDPQ